jgi:hypothetical protein
MIADSSARSDFEAYRRLDPGAIDLIVFDTTPASGEDLAGVAARPAKAPMVVSSTHDGRSS